MDASLLTPSFAWVKTGRSTDRGSENVLTRALPDDCEYSVDWLGAANTTLAMQSK